MRPISFKRHRFPPEIIRHAIWLYARFTLSFRDVEELLAERGIDASYETVRRWFLKFGPSGSRLSTIGACKQTTGRRTRISRYDAENENSSASNLPAQSNVSSPSMPPHSTHSPINVICCADRISRSFAPVHSPEHPPPHDACRPLHSPQLNADNVTKPLNVMSPPVFFSSAQKTPAALATSNKTWLPIRRDGR